MQAHFIGTRFLLKKPVPTNLHWNVHTVYLWLNFILYRHELDYRDFYRNERFRQSLASMYQHYPTQYPLNQGVPYGAAAAGYRYSSALPSGQFSEYRASLSLTNPASMTYQGFSNQISYPSPRMQYGASGGFHSALSLLPPPSMVPPVMPPTESAEDKTSPYYHNRFGASTSKYGVSYRYTIIRCNKFSVIFRICTDFLLLCSF